MNNGIICKLINFDIIENEKNNKTKIIIYKAVNTHPQYYLSLSCKKDNDTVICALVYTSKINKAIVIRDSLKNNYWIRYDYFVPLNKKCLQKSCISVNNPENIVNTIYDKHNNYKNQILEEKRELKSHKRLLKKAIKDERKIGITKESISAVNSLSKKRARIQKPNDNSNIPYIRFVSASRGNF